MIFSLSKATLAHETFLAPEMVKIPGGEFMMGCLDESDNSTENPCMHTEKPAHRVKIKPFSLSKMEITIGQYLLCVDQSGCHLEPELQVSESSISHLGIGEVLTKHHPVIVVRWLDAQDYVRWLSKQTGQTYRLPTEAEWEYAARAGTNTVYWWGNKVGKNHANCSVDHCGDNFKYTAPVGSFPANPFGLKDILGNVSEWVEDCFIVDYRGALGDGSARACAVGAKKRVIRGGNWGNLPLRSMRSTARGSAPPGYRNIELGFRVARTD